MTSEYRYLCWSAEGFVQQLAVSYLKNRYWFYVMGETGKDPVATDEKLLLKYEIEKSKWAKLRDQMRGESKVQYLRYERTFVLVATLARTTHPFFIEEGDAVLDVRERPIQFYGYSIGYKAGHPHVRISNAQYRVFTEAFTEKALVLSVETLAARLRSLPFEPYGPVKHQLRKLLWKVNTIRRAAGLEKVPVTCLRVHRTTVKPFDPPPAAGA